MTSYLVAYIDPGSGSILLQMLIGSAIGLMLFFRQSVSRLLRLFRRDT
jgi:hypothetical protein